MDKTVVVAVQWRQRHPVYRKSIRRISKFHAHDEQNDARIGDRVLIVETKPLSRLKRWRIAEILERHEVPEIAPQEIGAAIEEEIAQPEAAVAVADAPQAEEVGTAETEVAEEPEPEAAEESEPEVAEEPEPEAAEEPEPGVAEEPEPEAAEPEVEPSAEEATEGDVVEAVEPSADEAPSQDAPSTGQEPEVSTEEETGRTVEEREGKEGP
jgi:small subunit ribosomal protein S17